MSFKHILKNVKKFKKSEKKTESNDELTDEEVQTRLSNTQKALVKYGPKIWKEGSKLLTKKCRKVAFFGYHVKKTIFDMMEALQFYEALGIAANQVGHNSRIIIVCISTDKEPVLMINPEIEILDETPFQSKEGCLSFPGKYIQTKRPNKIRVKYIDQSINNYEKELEGRDAAIVLHENDHLNGVLFTEHEIEIDEVSEAENSIELKSPELPLNAS